jgi:hypothetical protein
VGETGGSRVNRSCPGQNGAPGVEANRQGTRARDILARSRERTTDAMDDGCTREGECKTAVMEGLER